MKEEDTFVPTKLHTKASKELDAEVKNDLEESKKNPEGAKAALQKALENHNKNKQGQCCGSGRCHD